MPHNTQAANGLTSHVPPPEQSKLKRRLNVNYVWHATTVRAPRAVRNGVQSFIKGRKKPASSDEAETGDTRKRVNGAKVNKEMIGPPIPQATSEQPPSPAYDNGRISPVTEEHDSSRRVPGAQVQVTGRLDSLAVSTTRHLPSTVNAGTGPDEDAPSQIPYDQHQLRQLQKRQNGLRLNPYIKEELDRSGENKRSSFGNMWRAQVEQLRTAREGGLAKRKPTAVSTQAASNALHSPSQDGENKRRSFEDMCRVQASTVQTARARGLTGRKPTVALAQPPRKGGSRLRPTNGHRQPWL